MCTCVCVGGRSQSNFWELVFSYLVLKQDLSFLPIPHARVVTRKFPGGFLISIFHLASRVLRLETHVPSPGFLCSS